MHFNYTVVGVRKSTSIQRVTLQYVQYTPLHSNWDELIAAGVPYFKPEFSMERK